MDCSSIKNISHTLALHVAKMPRTRKDKILNNNMLSETDAILESTRREVEKSLTWEQKSNNHHILTLEDPRYPESLKEIASPPIALFCKGNLNLISNTQIAIVGSRKASNYGKHHAYSFAKALSSINITVTSGMAKGIDASAASGALLGSGKTIAVLGTGINIAYPACNQKLQEQVGEEGLLISTFPIDTAPAARNFPQRNRIISGLSKGILVVEAEKNSGSLITAKYGIEQNREIFAIPGPINSSGYNGCNALIQQGAKLSLSPNDILDEILPSLHDFKNLNNAMIPSNIKDKQYLLTILNSTPISIDQIITKSNLNRSRLLNSILDLESNNFIKYQNDGYIKNY